MLAIVSKKPQPGRQISPQRWGPVASELLHLEESGEWRKTHESFSFYLSDRAEKANKTKSLFWRLLSAGREYNLLRAKLDPKGRTFPPLEDPRIKASPESLELVNKISRVAPANIVESVQRKAMAGEISRRELRNFWLAYRPVLGGKTARGRDEAPRYDKSNWAMRRALIEANSLALLSKNGPGWLGANAAYVYKVVHISSDVRLRHLYPTAPDAIVLLARDEKSPLEIHGVAAGFLVGENSVLQHYEEDGTSVDFLWFVTPKKLFEQEVAGIPKAIGVLHAGPDTLQVVRPAEAASSDRFEREELLRVLLREASH